jgi:hypothetical protein
MFLEDQVMALFKGERHAPFARLVSRSVSALSRFCYRTVCRDQRDDCLKRWIFDFSRFALNWAINPVDRAITLPCGDTY